MHLEGLFSIPISLFYSIKCCGLKDGLKLPIRISYKTKVYGLDRNSLTGIDGKVVRFSFGIGGSEAVPEHKKSVLMIKQGSKMVIGKDVSFGAGSVIRIENNAIFRCGSHVGINKNSEIYCSQGITIGDDCIFGWNVAIRDNDGHKIIVGSKRNVIEEKKQVFVGNHVWIAAHVDVLKGTEISNGSVVAYRSCVWGTFQDENVLIGGYPAKVLKREVYWEK